MSAEGCSLDVLGVACEAQPHEGRLPGQQVQPTTGFHAPDSRCVGDSWPQLRDKL